jgi:hypothetical protein
LFIIFPSSSAHYLELYFLSSFSFDTFIFFTQIKSTKMMLSTFNLVPTMTLVLFMAASVPQFALAKQELGSFLSPQDKDIKQALLQTNPIPDKLHRFQEVEEEVEHEFPFSVDLLIVGLEDALTESQKDLMGKQFMQDYNDISDDMQIVSIIVEAVELHRELMIEQGDEGRHLRRNLGRRRSLIARFRGLSLCRRCPRKRIRDPLFESRTKRGRRLNEDVTIPSDDEDLALQFLESFSIDLTKMFADVTDVQILV